MAAQPAFLSPWLLGTGLFFLYPLATTAYLSFTRYDGFISPTWDGLDNWRYVFSEYPFFWQALRNTLWFVVVMVTMRIMVGLGLGMLVVQIKRGSNVLRTLFYAPFLAPPVAATLAFVFLLNPGTGPVNAILGKLGLPEPGWFNDPTWSKPALTLLAVWGVGDLMVIFMAALLDVPEGALRGGGAGRCRGCHRFRHVTLPTPAADPAVRRDHRGDRGDAVLHRTDRRRSGRERADRRLGAAVRARVPREARR